MRIIGKYKKPDYYDGLSRDNDTLLYVRKNDIIPLKYDNKYMCDPIVKRLFATSRFKHGFTELFVDSLNAYLKGKSKFSNYTISIHRFLVLFCGQVYPGYMIDRNFETPVYFYNLKEVNEYLDSIGYSEVDTGAFTTIEDTTVEFNDVHMKYNCPIMILGYKTMQDNRGIYLGKKVCLELNPNLSDINFQKVMDHNQAYQEIEMYLSNILVSDKMPENPISDKLKAETHGFNKKSFRKEPTTKKK